MPSLRLILVFATKVTAPTLAQTEKQLNKNRHAVGALLLVCAQLFVVRYFINACFYI
jgi:hypothetical protein